MATNALHHGGGGAHEFEPDATNDPLLGTQEHPDQIQEVVAEPETESAAWPTHGRAEKSRTVAEMPAARLSTRGTTVSLTSLPMASMNVLMSDIT